MIRLRVIFYVFWSYLYFIFLQVLHFLSLHHKLCFYILASIFLFILAKKNKKRKNLWFYVVKNKLPNRFQALFLARVGEDKNIKKPLVW